MTTTFQTLTHPERGDIDFEVIEGQWPDDLSGEVFISAPETAVETPSVLFGPGHLIRLSLRPGSHGAQGEHFAWRSRCVQTPSTRLFQEAPALFEGTVVGLASLFGNVNAVNTAPVVCGDRLFVSWDAGRPAEVDPETLSCLGVVGSKDSWGGGSTPSEVLFPTIFTSAHPVYDEARQCLWTSKQDLIEMMPPELNLYVIRADQDGREVKRWPVENASVRSSLHSIAQTERWLIFAESGNFKVDFNEMMGMEREAIHDFDSRLWLLDKRELDSTPPETAIRPVEVSLSPSIGHCYAAELDDEGISLLCEHMDIADITYTLREGDLDAHGAPIDPAHYRLYNHAMARSTLSEVLIDPSTGQVVERAARRDSWAWNQQLSAMDWSLEGRRAPRAHHVVHQGCRPQLVAQRALEQYRAHITEPLADQVETCARLVTYQRGTLEVTSSYTFPRLDQLPTSPTFVPRVSASGEVTSEPGGHEGYLVVPVLSDAGSTIQLFDASDVSRGPVAVLRGTQNERIPVLLHSVWMSGATRPQAARAQVRRLSFRDELRGDPSFESLPEELKQLALSVADATQPQR